MSTALRPVLRPQHLPSLPSSNSTTTTYICHACRHARLLRRPKRPYTFTQLVTLSDGSAFTMRTTSPAPVYRSTRDTRNAPLWNPTSRELQSVEDDEAGRLAGFRARFGRGFDTIVKDAPAPTSAAAAPVPIEEQIQVDPIAAAVDGVVDTKSAAAQANAQAQEAQARERAKEIRFEDESNEFEEDDMNLLDLISSFGRPGGKSAGKKGGKK